MNLRLSISPETSSFRGNAIFISRPELRIESEAAVETRRAMLIRARKNIRDAQDALGRLLSDETINAVADVAISNIECQRDSHV